MFESLKFDALIRLQEKIDARVIRERALIFLTALAFVFMLWNFVVQSSIDRNAQAAHTQLELLTTQRTSVQTQIAAATQNLMNGPDKQKKAQITQLQAEVTELENKLQSVSQNLIKASQLPQALQDVLEKTSQLTLLEVKTLPARELQFVTSAAASEASVPPTEEVSAGVFQHVVELRVAGNYNQVVKFLTALEDLPWRFYWQGLEYRVDRYPNAEVILRVYTLSSEEGLFGV